MRCQLVGVFPAISPLSSFTSGRRWRSRAHRLRLGKWDSRDVARRSHRYRVISSNRGLHQCLHPFSNRALFRGGKGVGLVWANKPEAVQTWVGVFVHDDSIPSKIDVSLGPILILAPKIIEVRAFEHEVTSFPGAVSIALFLHITGVIGLSNLF